MEGLGIDFKLLIVQTVNFLILFFVLKKWVYPPFIRFLDERAKKIQESLSASEKMRQEVKDFEAQKEKELLKLKEHSQEILEGVRNEARLEKEKIIEVANSEAKSIIENARDQIEAEREKALGQVRREVIDLSVEISKKILSDVDTEEAERLVDQALKEKNG